MILMSNYNLRRNYNCRLPGNRKGIAVFATIAMITIVVMFIFLFSQNYLSSVNNNREMVFTGREAMHLAESAINETLLDFKAGMNNPAGSLTEWHSLLRDSIETNEMIETSFYPYYTEQTCETPGVSIEDVKVSIWALKPLNRNKYDRCGLLTITAVVAIKRRSAGLFNRYVYRNIQRSYQLKQIVLSPPEPFNQWTLFILKWPYLGKALSDYEKEQEGFLKRKTETEEALQTYMDTIPPFLDPKIAKADWALGKLEEVKKFVDKFEILGVGPSSIGWGPDDIQEGVDNGLANYNMTMDDARDVAATDSVGWMPDVSLNEVNWPSFRSDSQSLDKPVFSEKSPLTGSDFAVRFPSWPSLPPDPVISPDWLFTWEFPDLSYVENVFSTWMDTYNSSVPATYQSQWEGELRRHEGVFKLLDSIPSEYDFFHQRYQYRRASWRFKTNAEFISHITHGSKLKLNGGYWIKEAVSLSGTSSGSASVASAGDVNVNGLGVAAEAYITFYSGRNIDLSGSLKGSVVAPQGTVRFNGASVTGTVIENYHNGDDGFLSTQDSRLSSESGIENKVWFTVSPYCEATNLLRRAD